MWQLLTSFSEEEVEDKVAHKSNPASLEIFLLGWTTVLARRHTYFIQVGDLGRTNFIEI